MTIKKNLLEEAKKEFPDSLRFEKDDYVEGTYVRLTSMDTEYGLTPIIVMEGVDGSAHDKDGKKVKIQPGTEYSVWLIHSTLRDQAKKLRPKKGEQFGILYKGKVKSQSGKGREYHNYRMVIDREEEMSWDEVSDEPMKSDSSESEE